MWALGSDRRNLFLRDIDVDVGVWRGEPANGDAGRLSGKVDLIEFLGNEALATFQVGEIDVTALLPGQIRRASANCLKSGSMATTSMFLTRRRGYRSCATTKSTAPRPRVRFG